MQHLDTRVADMTKKIPNVGNKIPNVGNQNFHTVLVGAEIDTIYLENSLTVLLL